MKESGTKIYSMEKDLKNGRMVQYLVENIEMAKKMVQVNMNGEMALAMKENGKIMKYQDMDIIHGQMEENMLDIGKVI